MEELIEAYEEYIKLLEEAESANIGFLFAHGITTEPELIKKGKELRQKIKDLKANPPTTTP